MCLCLGMDTLCICPRGTQISSHIHVHKDEQAWRHKLTYLCRSLTSIKQLCIRREGCIYLCFHMQMNISTQFWAWMNTYSDQFEQVHVFSLQALTSYLCVCIGMSVHTSTHVQCLSPCSFCIYRRHAHALAYIAALHHRRCCDQRTCALLSKMHNRQLWFVLS